MQFRTAALPKKIAACAVAALAGFTLSGVRFQGGVSPFAAAYTAGASGALLLPAALGSALGALVFRDPLDALRYAGAVTLIVLFRLAHDKLLRGGREMLWYPAMAAVSVLLCSLVVGAAGGDLSGVVVTVCESLIAGACACFAWRVFTLLPSGVQMLGVSAGDTAAVLLSGSILLLSLDTLRVGGVSAAHPAAYLCILLLSGTAGEAVGAAAGITAGLMLGFAGENAFLAYFLPAAGLTCGVLSGYGKLASAGAFSVLGAMFIVLKGEAGTAFVSILEVAFAALVYALVPKKALQAVTNALRPLTGARFAAETRAVLSLRLRGAAKAVRDVSDSVRAVCDLLSSASPDEPSAAARVRERVCGSCLKREFCWGGCGPITQRAFETMEKLRAETGSLTPEDLPRSLAAVCRAPDTLISAFEREFCAVSARAQAQSEVLALKSLAAAQFGSVAAVLDDAALHTAAVGDTEPYLAALAKDVFTRQGFRFSSLCITSGANGKLLLEAFCTFIPRQPDYNLLLEELRKKTNVDFMPPVPDEYKKEGAVLTFCERTSLRPQFYRRSAAAEGENLCGDTVEAFFDGRGKYYVVLSDGMGTGKTAALDSVMTCTLFCRLLKAGFRPETALEAVNCALMVKSGQESLATVDLAVFDLYTGKTDFYKAGGAASVVQRGGRTAVVKQSSLPLGIMRDAAFEHTEVPLGAGDTVLLLSDGAGDLPQDYFKGVLYRLKDADAKTLCETVLADAAAKAPAGRRDDITVAAVRLR